MGKGYEVEPQVNSVRTRKSPLVTERAYTSLVGDLS